MIEKIIRKYAQSEVVSNMMLKNLAETGETYGIFEDVDSIKVHDEIKGLSDYASSLAKGSLTIRKIAFSTKEANEKTYLRIGIVPKNEASFNYLTEQNENGVSVFELIDGKPVLSNLQLVDSYAGRSDSQVFIVTGEEIGPPVTRRHPATIRAAGQGRVGPEDVRCVPAGYEEASHRAPAGHDPHARPRCPRRRHPHRDPGRHRGPAADRNTRVAA